MEFSTKFKRRYLNLRGRPRHWLDTINPRLYGSGRAALVDILASLSRTEGVTKALAPDFQCREVYETLGQLKGVNLAFYPVLDNLLPDVAALKNLLAPDPANTVVLLVDYFASTPVAELESIARDLRSWVIFDLVQSWPISAPHPNEWEPKWIVVAGYRKIFWRLIGALVFGKFAKRLPLLPNFMPHVAPHFPRNLTLRPRWGFLGSILLPMMNLDFHDRIARSWPPRLGGVEGLLGHFNSPVGLVAASSVKESSLGHWPDLWEELPSENLKNANRLKSSHVVRKK